MVHFTTMRRSAHTGSVLLAALCLIWLVAVPVPAQVKDWPTELPPRALPAHDVKFPPYEIRTLSNGMQVMVVMHHEQPVVSLRMLIRAGSAYEPARKQGLASLVASLLDQGTKTRSAAQIADTIDSIGGGLGTGAGSDLSFANVIVMNDSLSVGLELLSDVVRNPAFRQEEIERQRQQAISSLQVSYQDPAYVASLVFDRLVYGFHPYGLPNSGTPDSLASISDEDLHAFHDRYFVPNNAIFAIVGDVTAQEAFAGAERTFGQWARQELPPVQIAEPPPATRRLVIINKPDAVQTEIRVGQLIIPRKHPDYMAMDLAIKILGGEGSNRLHRVLRSERGLTYGAEADMQALKQAGDFAADTNTRTETTTEVLRLIFDEINRLQRERVRDRELADAQAYLAGSFPLTIETPEEIAAQVLNVLFYELPLSEIANYRDRVNAVTPDDIQRVAQQYLHPDRLSVVLVGNATAFTGQLKGLGFDQYELVNLADLDLTTVDLRRGSRPAPAATAPSGAHSPEGNSALAGSGH
jgi:zinc protease